MLTVRKGHAIFRQGDTSGALFYLVRGSVALTHRVQGGRELVLAYLYPGQFFGELGLFDNAMRRDAYARTRQRCTIAEISYQDMYAIAARFPEVMKCIAHQMAGRLMELNRKVASLVFGTTAARVADVLVGLCRNPEAVVGKDCTMIRTTRLEVSRIVGTSRETVGRVFKEFDARKIIRTDGRKIYVNVEKLVALPPAVQRDLVRSIYAGVASRRDVSVSANVG